MHRSVRWVYVASGVTFVGLGIIGAILPLMPSTVFFILALFCFERSSPKFEQMLLANRVVGPALRDWRNGGQISRRGKIAATTSIWICLAFSALFVGLAVKGLLLLVGVCLTLFLLTRPSPT